MAGPIGPATSFCSIRVIDAVIAVYLAPIVAIEGWLAIACVARRLFQNALVEIYDIAALIGVVGQHVPG